MSLTERILRQFDESARLKHDAAQALADPIAAAIELMFDALSDDHKILACGSDAAARNCGYFVSELVGHFERERVPLAAMALATGSPIRSALGNESDAEEMFARQVHGLGRQGDVLLAISTSGNSSSVAGAVLAAHERDMRVVALTGRGGGRLGELMRDDDVHICVPHERSARIQEVHLLILHCLCDGIDWNLLGEE